MTTAGNRSNAISRRSVYWTMWIVAGLALIVVLLLLRLQQANLQRSVDAHAERAQILVRDAIASLNNFYIHRARANLASEAVLQSLKTGDAERLAELSRGRHAVLSHENPHLKIMHFHSADGTSLLRMHHPQQGGDRIAEKRPMIAALHAKPDDPLTGLEVGEHGIQQRVVYPAFVEGRYVGALEFGIDPRYLLERIDSVLKGYSALVVSEKRQRDGLPAMQDAPRIGDYRLVMASAPFLAERPAAVALREGKRFEHGGRVYHLHPGVALEDFRGDEAGRILLVQDITDIQATHHRFIFWMILSSLVALALLYAIVRSTVGRLVHDLEQKHEQLLAIGNHMDEGLYVLDREGRATYINQPALAMLGYGEDDVLGKDIHELIHYQDRQGRHVPVHDCQINRAIGLGRAVRVDDDVFTRKDGSLLPVSYSASPLRREGRVCGSVALFRNITTELEAREILERQAHLFTGGPVAIFSWLASAEDDWPVEMASDSVRQWGYDPEDLISGRIPYARLVHEADLERVTASVRRHTEAGDEHFEDQYRILTTDGQVRWVHDFTSIRRDAKGRVTHYDGYLLDITELKESQLRLEVQQRELKLINRRLQTRIEEVTRLSETDPLTGVANRKKLHRVFDAELARSKRHGLPLSLMIFDLDHFKQINDAHGHLFGDEVLKRVTQRVLKSIRVNDLLARWGGEEFLILAPMTSRSQAAEMAEKLRREIAELDFGKGRRVTVSFGVAECPLEEVSDALDKCLKAADACLYRAKSGGRNRVAWQEAEYSSEMALS